MFEDRQTVYPGLTLTLKTTLGGKRWEQTVQIPNSMHKTNISLFITSFVKSLLSSSGLPVSGKQHEKDKANNSAKSFPFFILSHSDSLLVPPGSILNTEKLLRFFLSALLFPVVHFTYLPFAMPAVILFFFSLRMRQYCMLLMPLPSLCA